VVAVLAPERTARDISRKENASHVGARIIVLGLTTAFSLVSLSAQAKAACDLPSLVHQAKDEATIQRLEAAWNAAISKGDTDFESCLLTSDFALILGNGELKSRTDQLGLTAKNKGKYLPVPDLPKITVLIHGNVAVAYASVSSTRADGKTETTKFADYFVWEKVAWRAFFSQSTPVKDDSR